MYVAARRESSSIKILRTGQSLQCLSFYVVAGEVSGIPVPAPESYMRGDRESKGLAQGHPSLNWPRQHSDSSFPPSLTLFNLFNRRKFTKAFLWKFEKKKKLLSKSNAIKAAATCQVGGVLF